MFFSLKHFVHNSNTFNTSCFSTFNFNARKKISQNYLGSFGFCVIVLFINMWLIFCSVKYIVQIYLSQDLRSYIFLLLSVFLFCHLLSQVLSWNITNHSLFVLLIAIFSFSRENSSNLQLSSLVWLVQSKE